MAPIRNIDILIAQASNQIGCKVTDHRARHIGQLSISKNKISGQISFNICLPGEINHRTIRHGSEKNRLCWWGIVDSNGNNFFIDVAAEVLRFQLDTIQSIV